MINDQTFQREEAEFQQLFVEAGWADLPPADESRIEKIVERALHEKISVESIDFVFTGFGAVITNFAATFLGNGQSGDQDYRV